MTTMYEEAERWVDRHIATCDSETCGCSESERQKMLDGILEVWLFGAD